MALLLSSQLAASMVGGSLQQRVFNAYGIDTMLVPTVNFARHPGWGDPGGAVTEQPVFDSLLAGIESQGMFNLTDVVLTGYFADVGHVASAARAMEAVRKAPRTINGLQAFSAKPIRIVDPVMGDSPDGLFIAKSVAAAIIDQLLPHADLVTPNLFELGYLTGRTLGDLDSMVRAARSLARPVLVSSLPCQGRIGVMYVDEQQSWLVTHDRCPKAPHGTGDLLTAAFVSARIRGMDVKSALEQATAATYSIVKRANEWASPELPVVAADDVLKAPLIQLEAEAI